MAGEGSREQGRQRGGQGQGWGGVERPRGRAAKGPGQGLTRACDRSTLCGCREGPWGMGVAERLPAPPSPARGPHPFPEEGGASLWGGRWVRKEQEAWKGAARSREHSSGSEAVGEGGSQGLPAGAGGR